VSLGLTANQVTSLSLIGSVAMGVAMASDPLHPAIFVLLPLWQVLRTLLAALDGTMAVEFGQKSRVGGVLNEVGDLVSDVALVAPFAALPVFMPVLVGMIIVMALAVEGAGIASRLLGSDRRLEGPFGKIDRAVAFGFLGLWVSLCPPDTGLADNACLLCLALLVVTLSNRLGWMMAAARRHTDRTR
jgi:CDP-diacylglycerol--glycerol-3-phosphate 3-phosphatidyltransferase